MSHFWGSGGPLDGGVVLEVLVALLFTGTFASSWGSGHPPFLVSCTIINWKNKSQLKDG